MHYKLYRRLIPFARPYRGRIIVASVFNVLSNLFASVTFIAIIPIMSVMLGESKQINIPGTSHGASAFDHQKENLLRTFTNYFQNGTREETLIRLCVFVFVAFGLKNIFQYINGYLMAIVENGMIKGLRDKVFEKLAFLSIDYYYDRKAGHLLSRLTNDVSVVNGTLASSIMTLVGQPIQIGIFLWGMFTINPKLTLISFGIGALSMWFISMFGKTIKNLSQKLQEKQGDILTVAQETISGVKVVKSFGMEDYEVKRFHSETQKHFKSGIRLARVRGTMSPLNETFAVAGFIGILWFGGHEVFAGTIRGSELFFFLVALIALMQPIRSLSDLNTRLYEGSAAADNLFAILDAEQTVKPGQLTAPAEHTVPIQFDNVHFRYPNAQDTAINGIDLELFPNEVLALVGPSGGGKTTLVDLLARFYDPTEGSIYIGGRNIRDYTLTSVRSLFGIVTQDTVLFHDTIGNNISYGNRKASENMIVEAARAANAHDFIMQMPDGYETVVGDRGVRLSGGQRQRLAIARALLKDPPILIFDEATSALDTENEMLVQEAIQNLLSHRTAVVIAHRLSTIQQADRIAVIENGRIVELGSHSELLLNAGLYQRLYNIQSKAGQDAALNLT